MMTKKYTFYLVALSILALSFLSCKSSKLQSELQNTKSPTPATYSPWGHHLAWEISGKDLSEPSYVFGTMHIIPKDRFFLPEGVDAAFRSSAKIVFEMDMNEMSDMSAMMDLVMGAFMTDGKTLRDLLSDEDYGKVVNHFEDMGLPMMMLDRIKPMFLSMFATMDFDPSDMQSGEMVSYESDFFQKAITANKLVGGLETLRYQMGIFDSIPYKVQAEMLLDAIKSESGDSDMLEKTLQLYTSQDIEGMVRLIYEEESGMGGYEDLLLRDRNKNWIPLMEKEMKQQKTFFAVGAGHLAGEEGVLTLLKKKGYQVKPVQVEK